MNLEKLKDVEAEFLFHYPKGFEDEKFFPTMKKFNPSKLEEFTKESLKKERNQNQEYFFKLEELEKKVKNIKDKYELLTVGINKKISQISLMINEMKSVEEKTNKKIITVTDDIKAKDFLITRIEKEISIKGSKISDLEDVLEYRKTQIKEKKAKF